jgi:hypothetical protein
MPTTDRDWSKPAAMAILKEGYFELDRGNTEFNALIWMRPAGQRAGDIVLVDSTNFTTLFGGTESLTNFWHNLATMN